MKIDFDREPLTINTILNKVSEQEIYERYLGTSISMNKLYQCCFHKDSTPSLGFYKSKSNNLMFKCFGCGKQGSVFNFVKDLYNIDFRNALNLISKDFRIYDNNDRCSSNTSISSIASMDRVLLDESLLSRTKIIPTYQPFSIIDYNYWNQYHIPLDLLLEYDIRACKLVYIINKLGEYKYWGNYSKTNPVYSFKIDDVYKIYKPLNPTKVGKWTSNFGNWHIQGLKQLPAKGELLIITSSMKDVLVLKILGYNAIAPHGEGVNIPDKIVDYLYACFDNMVIFYDNDSAGLEYGNRMSDMIGAGNIHIPIEYDDTKDISDYVKKYGLEAGDELMKELL